MRRVVNKQLGELLVEKGVVSQEQLKRALKIQEGEGGLIGQILVALGYVSEEDIAKALTTQYGFPFLPLENYAVSPEVVRLIPENVSKQYNLIAIDKIADIVTIAMSNPLNIQAIEDIELITKCKVQVFVSTMTDINNALKKHYEKKQ